jgi:hypothetical protein
MGRGPRKFSKKTQSLLMRNRDKLKTVRAKNAEELIKQGKRWERVKIKMAEQERIDEVEAKREREKLLENRKLYVFDPVKVDQRMDLDMAKIKNKVVDIDLKDFLLSEKDNRLMKRLEEDQKREYLRAQERHVRHVAWGACE